jgi:hypothetical protein
MVSVDLIKKFGFDEELEEVPFVGDPGKGSSYRTTGHPKPKKRFKVIWEIHDLSIEEPYYWLHNYFEQDLGFPQIIKTEDVFAAAENSAFFGVSQQRLGAQQDKISQFLATIGKMIKELFQLVRELRVLDERLLYYKDAKEQMKLPKQQRKKSAEITLKGIFIDLVQGGAKNPASVYGMARELEFTTLPDLFFDAPPMHHEEVDDYVDSLEFNRKVIEVLKRHLKQFTIWKDRTDSEMKTRRRFTLQYLRQHFEIIKMYMVWVRPYLRHVHRLTMKHGFASDPEIISAFESSMVDIEILGNRPWKTYSTVIIATFHFRTRPSLKFVQEGYQRGPVHVGKMEMHLRGYIWTAEQIQSYIKMKEAEDFELMKTISGAVKSALEGLGDELMKYLDEAGQLWEKETGEKTNTETQPWHRRAFRDVLGPRKPKVVKPKKPKKQDVYALKQERKEVEKDLDNRLFLAFKNFKKGHGMIMW